MFLMKYWLACTNWHEPWADCSKWKQSGNWLLPCIGCFQPFLIAGCWDVSEVMAATRPIPWISVFKVSLIFFLSSSSISKLIELISYTCFTHIFVCWLLWASNGFKQPSKIDLSSCQLLVNRFCMWIGGFSWELYKFSSCLLSAHFQEQDFVWA